MVKIIGDTTSALSESFVKQHSITIIPQVINFGVTSYLEGVDLDYDTFMQKLQASKKLPKTAAPPPELFVEAFERLVPTGEPIICILPSAEVSGTVRSAMVGQDILRESLKARGQADAGLDIRIIDTRLIAGPVAALIELAVQWAADGLDADTIEARVRDMSARGKIYFSVATLKYLAMGGRIGGAAALVGSVLQVKPILTFREGRVDTFEKVRTHKRAVDLLKQLVADQIARRDDGCLCVMHSANFDEAQALADELAATLGIANVPVRLMPPAVVTHGGPGILGVAFFTDKEVEAEAQ